MAAQDITCYSVGCEPALGNYHFARDFLCNVAEALARRVGRGGPTEPTEGEVLGGPGVEMVRSKKTGSRTGLKMEGRPQAGRGIWFVHFLWLCSKDNTRKGSTKKRPVRFVDDSEQLDPQPFAVRGSLSVRWAPQRQRRQRRMEPIEVVLWIKIVVTVVAWAGPFLFAPSFLLEALLPQAPKPILWLRMLGLAWFALVVGYGSGLHQVRKGEFPFGIVYMGILSNGGGGVMLLLALLTGNDAVSGSQVGTPLIVVSVFLLLSIAAGLLLTLISPLNEKTL